ncbi:MAG: regulatory protein RecX [Pseudomonadota bacterium]
MGQSGELDERIPGDAEGAASGEGVSAYHRGLSLLVRREHSRVELHHKLSKRGYHYTEIEAALDCLEEEGYLSDARFAELFADQRVAKGFGPMRVKADLVARGIEGNQANCAIDALGVDWVDAAHQLLQAKCDASDDYAKLRRFLERRGYPAAAARAAISELLRDER